MQCQKCESQRVVSIMGKTSDMFAMTSEKGESYEGYVPDNIGIGSGDYIEFDYCLNCGQIQGSFPV